MTFCTKNKLHEVSNQQKLNQQERERNKAKINLVSFKILIFVKIQNKYMRNARNKNLKLQMEQQYLKAAQERDQILAVEKQPERNAQEQDNGREKPP